MAVDNDKAMMAGDAARPSAASPAFDQQQQQQQQQGFHGGGGDTGFVNLHGNHQSGRRSPNATSPPESPTKMKGRTDWVPNTPSPGPGAYLPSMALAKAASERTVFGTSRRENEEKRFISQMFNQTLPPRDTPGPGQYRLTHRSAMYPQSITSPTAANTKFGSAPQRPDASAATASMPGPIYELPETRTSIAFSFANPGTAPGAAQGSLISQGRPPLAIDPHTPGPQAYELVSPDATSPKRRDPAYSFGKMRRDQLDSLTEDQHRADPALGTMKETPGPIYDPKLPDSPRANKFGSAPQRYSPEKGGNQGGPFISNMHCEPQHGVESPGPGAYDYAQGRLLTDGVAAYRFGSASPSGVKGHDSSPNKTRTVVPGPGAYTPHHEALARVVTAPSYTLGGNLRTDFTNSPTAKNPGPGTYNHISPDKESYKSRAPAYSLGIAGSAGRSGFVAKNDCPGPNAYVRNDTAIDASPKRGFSFGVKERTRHEKSTVSIRYHGPLAAQEAMGVESPGPGAYDQRDIGGRTNEGVPSLKFDRAPKDIGPRLYFSKQHAESDNTGVESPGPGTYNNHETDLSLSTSRYKSHGACRFGTGKRFGSVGNTF